MWQTKIREHHIEVFALQQFHRHLGVLGQINVVTIFKRCAQTIARWLLVVHN